ncbi:MAG: phosphatidate cytidylyltransferase [Acidimicrobiales bacterium]
MADNNEQNQLDAEAAEQKTSIFDLFEPPPERDPNSFGKIPVIKDDEIDLTDSSDPERKAASDAEAAGLQHWTAPPTGQVPAILTSEKDENSLWADVAGPSWHGDDPSWAGPDLADVFADTEAINLNGEEDELDEDDEDDEDEGYGDSDLREVAVQRPPRSVSPAGSILSDETQIAAPPEPNTQTRPAVEVRPNRIAPNRVAAANDPTRPPAPVVPSRPGRHDKQAPAPEPTPNPVMNPAAVAADPDLDVDLGGERPAERRTLSGALADARNGADANGRPTENDGSIGFVESLEPSIDDIEFADGEYYDDDDAVDEAMGFGPVGGRNLPQAIGVGVALAAVVLAAMWFGPYPTLLLVVVLALLAVLELYNAMRMAGLRPATLLGIVGTVAAPAAAYYRGDAAFPLIVALAVVFGTLWYLVGADTERPVLNLSLTILGIFWVGGLAAFAALMLRVDGGIQLLLATILITVASDTMAYIGGRAYGSRPFHHASPNKTWEGTITGFSGAVFAGFAIGVTDMGTIWDGNLMAAVALGVVVGCLAPMGDLAESVVKRDLGVKDMGTLLPGHGGVLDRLDGLLFALPGAFYLALVYGLI